MMSGFMIRGNGNAGQMGLYAHAQASVDSPFHGGFWYSVLRDVEFTDFLGHSIWLRGGHTGFLLPNQFLTFDGVRAFQPESVTSRALLITGQSGQLKFSDSCEFDGETEGVGTNVELSREFTAGGGRLSGGTPVGSNAPFDTTFDGVTVQNAAEGYSIDACHSVFIAGWFENLHKSVTTHAACRSVSIDKYHVANAASDGVGGGYFVKVGSTCDVAIGNGDVIGSVDNLITSDGDHYGLHQAGISYIADAHEKTVGMVRQLSAVAGTLTTFALESVAVNGETGTPITTLTSYLPFGKTVTLRALGDLLITTGGNIALPRDISPLLLRSGESVVLGRNDLGADNWRLVSIARNRLEAATRPTTGYFRQGEFVWKTNPSVAGDRIMLGWSRLTTGNDHVDGADWSSAYVQTS
jgi:hypothetical protein